MPLLGRHMPMEGRAILALNTARSIGCDVVQIFVGNPRGWKTPADRPDETADLNAAFTATQLTAPVIHAAYLINLASSNPDIRSKSITLLRWTLERGAQIGASSVVMHIGSHGGAGLEIGIEGLVAALREVHAGLTPGPQLLLENDVGAGNTIGSNFTSLARVLARLEDEWGERLGVCIDTAHLWGAGIDIGTPESATLALEQMEAAFGIARIAVIHLNDTATKLGGHRDLHARLGEGIIGRAGLQALLGDPRLTHATIILETPIKKLPDSDRHDWDDERARIATARDLISGAAATQSGVPAPSL